MVSFTHEQNSICSQKQLNDIVHEHTIICRQLFAGQVVGSRPIKRKKHLHRMILPLIYKEKDVPVKYELTCQKGVWFSAKSGKQAEHWPRSYPCWKSFQSTEHSWSFPVCYPQFLLMVRDNISYTLR